MMVFLLSHLRQKASLTGSWNNRNKVAFDDFTSKWFCFFLLFVLSFLFSFENSARCTHTNTWETMNWSYTFFSSLLFIYLSLSTCLCIGAALRGHWTHPFSSVPFEWIFVPFFESFNGYTQANDDKSNFTYINWFAWMWLLHSNLLRSDGVRWYVLSRKVHWLHE